MQIEKLKKIKDKEQKVSVVMPAYNASDYIKEAIDSVLNQTYSNFELIIIDDASTDNTWEIIKSYDDKRIRPYKNEENLKIVKTRNKGFDLVSNNSKYIAIMDSDDICMPKRLKKEVNFLEKNKEYGLVGSHLIIINENSKKIGKRKYFTNYEDIKKNILVKNPIAQPSVMIRKKVIDEVSGYTSEGYDRSRDYDLWIRIFDKYKIINIDDYLLKYRVFSEQGKSTHLKETLKSTIQIQKKWLFKKKYFNFKAFLNLILEYILLLFPKRLILWLFKKKEYDDLWK